MPYVMVIGSWAEYIYQHYHISGFVSSLRTRDVDFFYYNIGRPQRKNINIIENMKNKGFAYIEDSLTGIGKFYKEDLLELEFLTSVLGKGKVVNDIPSLKIKAEGLREINMLADYPLEINCDGHMIRVPELEIYILQKLFTNPTRIPKEKQEKDMRAVKELLHYVNIDRVNQIFNCLTKKEKKTINETKQKYSIDFAIYFR